MRKKLCCFKFMIFCTIIFSSSVSSSTQSSGLKGSHVGGTGSESNTMLGTTVSTPMEIPATGNESIATIQANVILRRNMSTSKCGNNETSGTSDDCVKRRKKKRQNAGELTGDVIYVDYIYDDTPEVTAAEGNKDHASSSSSQNYQTFFNPSPSSSTQKHSAAPGILDSGAPLELGNAESEQMRRMKNDQHVASSSSEEVPTSLNVLFDFLSPAKGKDAEVTLEGDIV